MSLYIPLSADTLQKGLKNLPKKTAGNQKNILLYGISPSRTNIYPIWIKIAIVESAIISDTQPLLFGRK